MEQISEARYLLNSRNMAYIIGMGSKNLFNECIDLIEDHIKKIDTGERIDSIDDTVIKKSLRFLISLSIEVPDSDKFRKFLKSMVNLIYNWNLNTNNNKDINNKCLYLDRVSNDSLTLGELINTFETATNRLKRRADFQPKSFSLSTHYFNIIED